MTNNNTAVLQSVKTVFNKLAQDMVLIPSAVFPGTKFVAVTTPEIRAKNLARWQRTEARYRDAKAAGHIVSVKDAIQRVQHAS